MRLRPRLRPAPPGPDIGGLSAFASRHAPDWSMASRTEPWHKLLLVLSGGGWLEGSQGRRELAEDHLLLIPAGMMHRLVDPPGSSVVVAGICADPRRLEAVCAGDWPRLAGRLAAGVHLDAPAREAALQLIGGLVTRRPGGEQASALAAWGALLSVLAAAMRRPAARAGSSTGGAGVARALAWLDEHASQPVSVGELAARAGLGYRTFTLQVRRATGESVLHRILRLRLERAWILLRSGMPVSEAALASGFGDLSGFYRHFRRRFGMPPGRCAAAASR